MKTTLLILILVLTLSFTSFAQKAAAGKAAASSTSVQSAFDRLVDGIKQVDAKKVMSAYEKSDRLLIFNNNGTATIGWDNVNKNVTDTYAKLSNVTLDITGLRVEMLGPSAAYVTCKWVQSQENDGKVENASGRMTLAYRLIGKEWKIVHRHTSPDRPGTDRPVFPSERQTGTP
jgi:ketosteroid isomerase-like protein